jgi:hypothetical protein
VAGGLPERSPGTLSVWVCQVQGHDPLIWCAVGVSLVPLLFNFFVSDYPSIADLLSSYTDNFTVLESDSILASLDAKLQASVTLVTDWAKLKKLTIASTKSLVTLFTPYNHQFNYCPAVIIDGVDISLNRVPKILGVTFEIMFCYREHYISICAKSYQRLNILRAVAGSSWGQDMETFLITYWALIESVMNFAAPVWFPHCKPTNTQKLLFIQNAALRLITGCHKASPVSHLHAEAKVMPVAEHLSMLYGQFLASCM